MIRWGQIPGKRSDAWFDETAKKVYRPDVYEKAARMLAAEGKFSGSDH